MRYTESDGPFEGCCVGTLPMEPGIREPASSGPFASHKGCVQPPGAVESTGCPTHRG
jgi:hypothetical protein